MIRVPAIRPAPMTGVATTAILQTSPFMSLMCSLPARYNDKNSSPEKEEQLCPDGKLLNPSSRMPNVEVS